MGGSPNFAGLGAAMLGGRLAESGDPRAGGRCPARAFASRDDTGTAAADSGNRTNEHVVAPTSLQSARPHSAFII